MENLLKWKKNNAKSILEVEIKYLSLFLKFSYGSQESDVGLQKKVIKLKNILLLELVVIFIIK